VSRQDLDSPPDGAGRGDITEGEEVLYGQHIQRGVDAGVYKQRLRLRGEQNAVGQDAIPEGLLSERVSGGEKLWSCGVVDDEGEQDPWR